MLILTFLFFTQASNARPAKTRPMPNLDQIKAECIAGAYGEGIWQIKGTQCTCHYPRFICQY